jgi:hypothetical protein
VIIDGEGATTVRQSNHRAFVMQGSRSGLRGVTFDTTGVGTSGFAGFVNNATDCFVERCSFPNAKADIYLTGTTTGCRLELLDMKSGSVGITLDGADVAKNEITRCRFTDCVAFGVYLKNGAHHNRITANVTYSNGIELIGLAYNCHSNIIALNHAEGTGDNGISVTGHHNVVVGNICKYCHYSGLGIYGSYNSVSGNVCLGNGQVFNNDGSSYPGILIQGNFGGVGEGNSVSGNTTDDDQTAMTQAWGILLSGVSSIYPAWSSGLVVTAGTFVKNGQNIYYAAAGGTTGTTAPVHTSGTVSDGGVSWLWVNSWTSGREPYANHIGLNATRRSRTGIDVLDSTVNASNFVADTASIRVADLAGFTGNKYDSSGIIRHLKPWANGQVVTYGAILYASSGHVYRCTNVGGTCSVEPSHATGTITGADGIAWLFVVANSRDYAVIQTNNSNLTLDSVIRLAKTDQPTASVSFFSGAGSPEGKVTAPIASFYLRGDGGAGTCRAALTPLRSHAINLLAPQVAS